MNSKSTENRFLDDKGFTLIELVAAIAIMAIILTPLTMVSLQGIRTYYHEQEKIDLMESGQFALFKISKQIRVSSSPVQTSGTAVIVSLDDGIYTYHLDGTNLTEKIDGGTENAIAENIDRFDVTKSGNLLTIDLGLSGPKYGETIDLKTSIYLRNQQ